METTASAQTPLIYPNLDLLMPHQVMVMDDPHRFKVLVWHRRARKTTTALTEIIKQALYRKGVYWCIFPTYSQAKDAVWRDPNQLFRVLPKEFIARTNETELVVYLKNGSVIQLKGGDDVDSLRGAGIFGAIFDEAEKVKEEAWQVVEPILRANNGFAWFVGTPMGKNWFYKLFQRGQVDHPEWKSWLLKASTSGIIKKSQLEEARKTATNEAFYNQEWECAWIEGTGQVFRGVREVMTSIARKPNEKKSYVMGVDLAKYQDYTVIVVYDWETNQQVYQDRFNKYDWNYQKEKIKAVSKHYNNALVVIDATGLGDPIADDLTKAGVPIEPFKITSQTKTDLINKLSIFVEQRKMKMINLPETLREFDNFGYILSPTGKYQFGGIQGEHDDIVIAHALAVYKLNDIFKSVTDRPKTIIQSMYESAKRDMNFEQSDSRDMWEWENNEY